VAKDTRERSVWAWGWRAKFPDDGARAGLVQLARALVPAAQPALRAPPTDEPSVAAPAVAVPAALAAFASQAPRDRAMRSRGRAFPISSQGSPATTRARPMSSCARATTPKSRACWRSARARLGRRAVRRRHVRVGGVDAALARGERAAVVSLDLGALAGVREVDPVSRLARIGAGRWAPRSRTTSPPMA